MSLWNGNVNFCCYVWLADNWKVCASSKSDNCPGAPVLPPDEDDPQCIDKLPWACCTKGPNIPGDNTQQCQLTNGTCPSGTLATDENHCENTDCVTYSLNATDESFTFYVGSDDLLGEIPWPTTPSERPCGGDGQTNCPTQSKV
jgi:hypothetical protein